MSERYAVVNGECLEEMRKMDADSMDAIVTDPPYGLAFMGAKWDSFGKSSGGESVEERREKMNEYLGANAVVPAFASSHGRSPKLSEMREFQATMTPIFAEALRVAKPGAYLLCFGGTRTFHRMACAIEDAGWSVRDTIMWVYGSGFPHGMDVSKAIDRKLGAKRERVPNPQAAKQTGQTGTKTHSDRNANDFLEPEPVTELARRWDGWNTALKPAWEPIIVAQKPLDGTVAHNVLTHGVGAMNIDACRVPTEDKLGGGMKGHGGVSGAMDRPWMHDEEHQREFVERKKQNIAKSEELGRYPANLIHDGSEEVVDLFPNTKSATKSRPRNRTPQTNAYGTFKGREGLMAQAYGDEGSAARFFYCAKASKKDRGEGNTHPTCKPTKLMRYLVKLVCPTDGTVLDPFMGSGSTGVAALQEGMRFVGIDMEEEYCEMARKRMSEVE